MEFRYQDPYPIQKDDTVYKKLTSDYVKVEKLGDREILTVDPKGLELLAEEAMADVSFMLRSSHLESLKRIIDDPEATDNDRFVAYNLLQNAAVAAEGALPSCQDTGTAIVMGKKGENVYTGVDDGEYLSKGIYNTYRTRSGVSRKSDHSNIMRKVFPSKLCSNSTFLADFLNFSFPLKVSECLAGFVSFCRKIIIIFRRSFLYSRKVCFCRSSSDH